MEKEFECPVCKTKITKIYYNDLGHLAEEFYSCHHCGYGYQYAYGSTLEYVNGKEFNYDYKTDIDEKVFKNIAEEIKLLKTLIENQDEDLIAASKYWSEKLEYVKSIASENNLNVEITNEFLFDLYDNGDKEVTKDEILKELKQNRKE
ncbi:MAG: hypothetical protein K0Q47_55 [Sedimentibacter sp.]|jgi:rubredoxin|nr:hypothetical protein [Sedimentibacter sp.]